MPKFRTKQQNSRMFGLAAKIGLSHEDLRDYAADVSDGRTEHTSKLYINEAKEVIHRLEQLLPENQVSRRTVNYRRQKTGVPQIVTPQHIKLMNDLWFKFSYRTASGLESICLKTIKVEKPRTTAECNKIIEAIKDMNRRERKRTFGDFKAKEIA